MKNDLDSVDHIAIVVDDIKRATQWYKTHFKVQVIYEDDTWVMLQFANIKLALVVQSEHPAHFAIPKHDADVYGQLTKHRDDIESVYIKDSEKNTVEIIKA